MLTLRFFKIGMVASIALFFSLVAFNNIIDSETNLVAVKHVLSMNTTLQHPAIIWRAITNPNLQLMAYYIIIAWQILTALLCWLGCIKLLVNIHTIQFNSAKQLALTGLFCGFLLYMVGFMIIAGEWFTMWQSNNWNFQSSAGLFLNFILFTFLILQHKDIINDIHQ